MGVQSVGWSYTFAMQKLKLDRGFSSSLFTLRTKHLSKHQHAGYYKLLLLHISWVWPLLQVASDQQDDIFRFWDSNLNLHLPLGMGSPNTIG